ncbi:hypothetical protein LENED_012539 [Lentinula edodes]|uniref:Uncharacterized protein n=1 Tax=Lentinula edodes TaxID=5353 RepID=A0A1Q3ESX8_LENED|nr:hypothetical protein LENED_012539 [Lentinula edodes]
MSKFGTINLTVPREVDLDGSEKMRWTNISAVAHEAYETKNEKEMELQINVAGMEMHSNRTRDSFGWKLRNGISRAKNIL